VTVTEHRAELTLVLGGARSGKSLYAERIVSSRPAPWTYIATAQSFDAEMSLRITEHRQRRVPGWVTIDAPLDLVGALHAAPPGQPVLVDCLTLWLTNVLLAGQPVEHAIEALVNGLDMIDGPCVMVSNEVGLGIVPDNALARAFRDHAGRLHQQIASKADRVVFMVAGIPMVVKS
jgi:adenosylcobinamide kinase / adenosylcobinamide-phosphate guanylyltransferase